MYDGSRNLRGLTATSCLLGYFSQPPFEEVASVPCFLLLTMNTLVAAGGQKTKDYTMSSCKSILFSSIARVALLLLCLMSMTNIVAQTEDDTLSFYVKGHDKVHICKWDISNDSVWITVSEVVEDSDKISAKMLELDKKKRAWADSVMQAERSVYEAEIAKLEALMQHEKDKTKVEDEGQLAILKHLQHASNIPQSSRRAIDKGKVPKGMTEWFLNNMREKQREKIAKIRDPYRPVTWSDARSWNVWDGHRPPQKVIYMRVRNPYCVDNYLNGTFQGGWNENDYNYYSLIKGWEWAERETPEDKEEHYPHEIYYRFYVSHPDYRVRGENNEQVYNNQGKLVRILKVNGSNYDLEKELLEELCKRDFLANKYDIKSASPATLTALRIRFGITDGTDARFDKYMKMAEQARDEKAAATTIDAYNRATKKQDEALSVLMEYVAKEREPQALKYIEQLKEDHKDDFKYLYRVVRLDNLCLKFYWLNADKQLSCVGKVTWKNDGLFNSQYTIELLPNEEITIKQ